MRTVLALMILMTACAAQTRQAQEFDVFAPPSTDVLRGAMQTCSQHLQAASRPQGSMAPGGIPTASYAPGWEHCTDILAELRRREAEALSDATRDATKALADRLKGQ
jgi:hypothetical protein